MANRDGLWFEGMDSGTALNWIHMVLDHKNPNTFSQAVLLVDPNGTMPRAKILRAFNYLGIRFEPPRMFRKEDPLEQEDVVLCYRRIIKAAPTTVFAEFCNDCEARAARIGDVREMIHNGASMADILKTCRTDLDLPGLSMMKVADFVIPPSDQ